MVSVSVDGVLWGAAPLFQKLGLGCRAVTQGWTLLGVVPPLETTANYLCPCDGRNGAVVRLSLAKPGTKSLRAHPPILA